MKLRACDCLNIIIKTETNDFVKVNSDSLKLSPDETNDVFFQQDVQQVGKLVDIDKVHGELICSRNVGSWTIFHCINCDVHSYAVHREKGALCILIASRLLTDDAISSLKNDDSFSSVFNIIVKPSVMDSDERYTYLASEHLEMVNNLKEVMSDAIRKESLAVHEKIQIFRDKEFEKLNKFQKKAFAEQQSLIKVILNSAQNTKVPDSANRTMTLPGSIEEPSRLKKPLVHVAKTQSPQSPGAKKQSPSKRQKSASTVLSPNSIDTAGFFPFEGFDDLTSAEHLEVMDDSETDEEINVEGGGQPIPRHRSGSVNLAKSLPMNIPVFLSKMHSNEDLDDFSDSESRDIAASIKALAKSVHGDTIFGDLPRPRFSTQI